jgi:NAD+ synthase (glutamine-hydrolysing)
VTPSPNADNALEVALCQINPVVGDLVGNADLIITEIQRARESGAQLVVFPELALSGYPPEDLVLRHDFVNAVAVQLDRVAKAAGDLLVMVGFPESHEDVVANSLAVIADGEVKCAYRKILLPNYGVFDERRYFTPGDTPQFIEAGGIRIGVSVCEDIWFDDPVVSGLAAAGVQILVNASASPFHSGKTAERERMVSERAKKFGLPILYCNMFGGQDELVFDGASAVFDADGNIIARADQFAPDFVRLTIAPVISSEANDQTDKPRCVVSLPSGVAADTPPHVEPLNEPREHEAYDAIMLGIRDYVDKNGFPGVLIGVSGGIDSAVVLALACDALGADRVTAVTMPSPYNSSETRSDALEIARNFGCKTYEFGIEPIMKAFDEILADTFNGLEPDQTEENIQARIRGTLLMALSNKFGSLVLTTGNKTEMAVGYATLYGDMAGGFAPLKDVPKLLVFGMARWRNEATPYDDAVRSPIPASTIERPPSAELKPGQTDEASLGSYETLDEIVTRYIERDESLEEIVAAGIDRELAQRILNMIDRAEYKRRQAPPGVKITPRAFGRDRRMPITARRRYT